jgi:hypothetical protein
MSRLLAAACVVTLLIGCAKALSSFSDEASAGQSQALEPSRTCGSARTPPVPLVQATRHGDRIRVEYDLLARPVACAPDAVLITANSVAKVANVAPSPTNGLIRLTGTEGTVELELPPLDLPPYEVRAATLTPAGARSATTKVRVSDRGDYCLRRTPATTCIRRAELKLERCLRGEGARRECPGYVWRTRPPVPHEPVQGVTRAGLERSFTSLLSSTEYGDAALDAVYCASTRECVVTWQGDEGAFSARFDVSGYRQRAGCWIAERNLRLSDPLPHHLRACVDWEWNR